MRLRWLSALLLLATSVAGLSGCGGDELKVGVILPMSGNQSTYGDESWKGIQLAQKRLEEDESVPFVLIHRDENSEPLEGSTQAKALMEVEGVHVILGSVASSITKAIGQAAREMGTPVITPASTNDDLTKENAWLSRICYKDAFQGLALANFALQQGWRRAAVLVDKKNDYSLGLARNFEERYRSQGGEVHKEFFNENDTDFSQVIQGVATWNPQVIFIAGYYTEAGMMLEQAKGKWGTIPVIAGDGVDSPKFIPLLGDAPNPVYFSTHFSPDQPDPAVQEFARRYEATYGEKPGAMAALGYDALMVLMDAVKRADDPRDPESLQRAIASTRGVKGVTGTIDLANDERTPVKDIVFVKVQGGKREYHATVKP